MTTMSNSAFRSKLKTMGIEPRRVGPYDWKLKDGAEVVASGVAPSQKEASTAARAALAALPPRADGKRRRCEFICTASTVEVGR